MSTASWVGRSHRGRRGSGLAAPYPPSDPPARGAPPEPENLESPQTFIVFRPPVPPQARLRDWLRRIFSA